MDEIDYLYTQIILIVKKKIQIHLPLITHYLIISHFTITTPSTTSTNNSTTLFTTTLSLNILVYQNHPVKVNNLKDTERYKISKIVSEFLLFKKFGQMQIS